MVAGMFAVKNKTFVYYFDINFIGETFPDGTPYIVNPQNYFPNSQAPTGPSATGKQVGSSGGGGGGSGGYSGG